MPYIVLLAFLGFFLYLLKRDTARREGVSSAIWIPTLWAGILASRPVSAWLGVGGAVDTMEGSPMDRLFYFGAIFAALVVLSRRRVPWGHVMSNSWPVFAFYGFMLVSVVWADSPIVSFKRWFKDFGNVFIAMVVLTEKNPIQAFRAVFVRCGYLLIPLSVIFLRWFPHLGRQYNVHSGMAEATGVTFQKNSLGALVIVCGLVIIWDWFESKNERHSRNKIEKWMPIIVLGMGLYLLHVCDSKTSLACLLLGGSILWTSRVPFFRKRIGAMGAYSVAGTAVFFALDSVLQLKEAVVGAMGRDMTFTGRTEVWDALFALKTNPLIGTGFCSFWSDEFYQSKLPSFVAFSAHNGYIEMYLDGGAMGVAVTGLMVLGTALKINSRLKTGTGTYSLMRFAVLAATIIGNFSESHFARMTPLWTIFLIAALEPPAGVDQAEPAGEYSDDPDLSFASSNPSYRG